MFPKLTSGNALSHPHIKPQKVMPDTHVHSAKRALIGTLATQKNIADAKLKGLQKISERGRTKLRKRKFTFHAIFNA
jgi:hypothetical protein